MDFLQKFQSAFYVAMRFLFGAMFALHGAQKILGFPTAAAHKLAVGSQLWIGGVLELGLGALIAVGLFTRVSAFLASGMMAVAYFQFHKGYVLEHWGWLPIVNQGESAVMYCFAFLYIASHGPGRAAFDRG